MLTIFDILLHIAHLSLISFNLFGWIFPKIRRANLYCLLLTAFSWFGLGLYYGLGYCPLTDWQWQVKLKLGQTDLPNSYIKYLADGLTGLDLDPVFIDVVTVVAFFSALAVSIYVNFRTKKFSHA
jgi:hypothetical protein